MRPTLEDRIQALGPDGKKLFFKKLQEELAVNRRSSDKNLRKQLVAYIETNEAPSIDALKIALKKSLPDYMVPTQFIRIPEMPLLPNGKIDRKQLKKKKPAQQLIHDISPSSPATSRSNDKVVALLLKIWEEVLGFSPIQKDDNFFEIGGDSIMSIQIVARARKQGITIQSTDLFEHQTVAELSEHVNTVQNGGEKILTRLRKIWEDVLGFAPIHEDDNFFEIGGDSILSIQIIAKAKDSGIAIPANALFKHQTLKELVLFAKTDNKRFTNTTVQGEVPLSPIQHWFFNDHKNAPEFWNQAFRLDGIAPKDLEHITKVCNHIATQHDALRAKFFKDPHLPDGHWSQFILSPNEVQALHYIDLTNTKQEEYTNTMQRSIKEIQKGFTLSEGNLFKCLYFVTGKEEDFCVLLAHHLVIDAVSWQILIDDFTTLLNKTSEELERLEIRKTNSIKDWNTHVASYINNISNREITFWQEQIEKVEALPTDKQVVNIILEKEVSDAYLNISEEDTERLLQANKAYSTKIDELLITAFTRTIHSWSSHREITIGFERHGRETEGTSLDLSKTVGWFTAYFPLRFTRVDSGDLGTSIASVKEKMRTLPNGGLGYGALRYLTDTFGNVNNPEIVFNYLGNKQAFSSINNLEITPLSQGLRSADSERHYKLELNLAISRNSLQVHCSYGNNLYDAQTITDLMDSFKREILAIIDYCHQDETGGYTPSDFSDADISQDDLDSLLDIL